MSDEKQFIYAGGEFENDAPYVDEDDAGGVDGMTSLLSELIGSGSYDDADHADTCFSQNAAASFAALSAPEEQVSELTLKALDAESLVSIADVITPVELMQVILLLEFTHLHTAAAVPAALHSIPTFYATAGEPSYTWFIQNEKLIMQTLSLLGIGLNHENAISTSSATASPAASASSSPSILLYSLLHHGSKVSSSSSIDSILHDLFQLLALPDVLDLDSLTKQLVREIGLFLCSTTTTTSEDTSSTPSAASSPSPASSVVSLSSLRSKFVGALATDVATGASFIVDLSPASNTVSITLPSLTLAELQSRHRCRSQEIGEVYVRAWTNQWRETFDVVQRTIQAQLASSSCSASPSSSLPSFSSFLSSLSSSSSSSSIHSSSSLASLLSEGTSSQDTAELFRTYLEAFEMNQTSRAEGKPSATTAAASL